MNVTVLDSVLSGDVQNAVTFPRTPGCHVTDIIAKLMAKIDPATYGTPIEERFKDDTIQAWRGSGFMWEELLTRMLAERSGQDYGLTRASELTLDGIIGTPDWFGIRPVELWRPNAPSHDVLYLFESKFTWKSMREWAKPMTALLSPKFCLWLFQMRAYCWMLETPYALLSVLFANGDYTQYVPRQREFVIEFSYRELEENWATLKRTAKKEGLLL